MNFLKKITARYGYSFILLKQLAKTDFKLRYQGSILGYLWSLIRPLFMFIILYFVFTRFLKIGTEVPNYPIYLLLGIVLWNFFLETTSGSVSAIVARGDLLRKINFPKYIIIFAVSIAALINLLLNFIVIFVFMYFSHIHLTATATLLVPIIIELYLFALAISFFLSTAFVRLRDVSYIWDVLVQAGFYLTPILYALTRVPNSYAKIMILSPVAQTIQDARYVLVTKSTITISSLYGGDKFIWLIPISIVVVSIIISSAYFRKRSKYFAEEV